MKNEPLGSIIMEWIGINKIMAVTMGYYGLFHSPKSSKKLIRVMEDLNMQCVIIPVRD